MSRAEICAGETHGGKHKAGMGVRRERRRGREDEVIRNAIERSVDPTSLECQLTRRCGLGERERMGIERSKMEKEREVCTLT